MQRVAFSIHALYYLIISFAVGLISKNQTSSGEKELSGMTLRDLWENSSNTANKPLAPIGGGLSVSRANAGEDRCLIKRR